MSIDVALLAGKGEFGSYSSTGSRFYRYPHMLYTLMSKNKIGINIHGVEAGKLSAVGKAPALFYKAVTTNFNKYDIVHSLDLSPLFPLKKGKAKFITTAHDFQFLRAPEYNVKYKAHELRGKVWQSFMLNASFKAMFKSDYLIAVSTLTRDDAVKLGFDKKKIFVVNHGIDKRFFTSIKNKKRKDFTVGYISGISLRKNLSFAIRAFKMIKEPGYKFDVWGGKFWYDEPYQIAKGDKRITFKGYVPDDKIVSAYDSLDVFVLPTFYEGFSIPIIEAQARGIPVVIYKEGKVPQEARKFCFEAEDEQDMANMIVKLRENGYSQKTRRQAMLYARSFTWEKSAQKTLEVYKTIMEE